MEMREKDLVEKYELYLRGWLKGKIEDSRDREEVLANILWAVVNSYPSFAGKSSLKTWVVAIAKKRLVDFYFIIVAIKVINVKPQIATVSQYILLLDFSIFLFRLKICALMFDKNAVSDILTPPNF